MTKLNAGTPAKSGHYFNLSSWTLHGVETDGEQLPGEAGERWLPVSLPVAVALAPLLGAAFLMFLPAIGFFLVAKAFAQPVVQLFHRSTEELVATMSPGLVPGEAHLTGKRGGGTAVEEAARAAAEDRELDALQAQIDARRASRS
jgi:hypothetical protein